MNKNEALKFLNDLQRFGWQLGLERMLNLLAALGNPQQAFKSVHVAGTNGKGSTCAMLESIYRHSGYRTGRFTSPHLVDVRERICVSGAKIPEDIMTKYISDYAEMFEHLECTYFEALTAVAFKYFADATVDLAIVEVGLGGRFDATNLLEPELVIITSIALDHVEHLGNDISRIASEKAGIIKPGSLCLSQNSHPDVVDVLRRISCEQGAEIQMLDDFAATQNVSMSESSSVADMVIAGKEFNRLRVGLPGAWQLRNALLATAAVQLLQSRGFKLNRDALYHGLANVQWPGRLQKVDVSPTIIVDVAHNVQAMEGLVEDLVKLFQFQNVFVVVGLLADKNWQSIVEIIGAFADQVWVVSPKTSRALAAEILFQEFTGQSVTVKIADSVDEALLAARRLAGRDDLICVTGSHYVVGALACEKKMNPPVPSDAF